MARNEITTGVSSVQLGRLNAVSRRTKLRPRFARLGSPDAPEHARR
jgi:hypothetical protein